MLNVSACLLECTGYRVSACAIPVLSKTSCACTQLRPGAIVLRPYQFDLLIHEYGDSIFSKNDL